jgi:ribosomal protein L37AE/L43A
MSENRAPAQFCPYCGETNLWPHEDSHGAWSCRDCQRVFAVRFIGIAGRSNPAPVTANQSSPNQGAEKQAVLDQVVVAP